MKKSELKKYKKHFIAPAMLIIIVFLMPYSYVDNAVNSYDSSVQAFDSTYSSAKKLKQSQSEAKNQLERYKQYENAVTTFEKAIPYGKQLPDIIDDFNKIANEAGVSLNDVRYMKSEAEKDISVPSIRFDMHISGEYASIVDFLRMVETMKYLAYNEEVQLSEGSSAYSVKVRVLTK